MKKIVINKTERLIICGDITLLPGANQVDEKFFSSKNKRHQMVLGLIMDQEKQGRLEIPEADVEDDFADDILGALNAKDAVATVKETNDLDTLEEYYNEERTGKKRKSVVEAIEAQIKKNKAALVTKK